MTLVLFSFNLTTAGIFSFLLLLLTSECLIKLCMCGQPCIQATGYQQLTLGVVFECILRGAEPTDSWAICSHNTTFLSTLSNEGS